MWFALTRKMQKQLLDQSRTGAQAATLPTMIGRARSMPVVRAEDGSMHYFGTGDLGKS